MSETKVNADGPIWVWSVKTLRIKIRELVETRDKFARRLATLNSDVNNRVASIVEVEALNAKVIRDGVIRAAKPRGVVR